MIITVLFPPFVLSLSKHVFPGTSFDKLRTNGVCVVEVANG